MPEFYVIFARQMSEFYIIIVREIFSPNFRGARAPLTPVFYAYEVYISHFGYWPTFSQVVKH